MQLEKRLKDFLIYTILISFTSVAAAQNVTKVAQGDPSPYSGWCIKDSAMAKIMRNFIRSTLAGMFLILNKMRISFMDWSCNNPN